MTRINCELSAKNLVAEIQRKIDQAFLEAAKKDAGLTAKLLRWGAERFLSQSFTADRKPPAVLPAEAGRIARQKFMERYTLFGGAILLADATQKTLAESARQHDAQANGHNMAAAFEREIANRLPVGKRVRNAFSDKELIALKKGFTTKRIGK
jgi:hypothetical protein